MPLVSQTVPRARHSKLRGCLAPIDRVYVVLIDRPPGSAGMGLAAPSAGAAFCRRCRCRLLAIKASPRFARVSAAMVREGEGARHLIAGAQLPARENDRAVDLLLLLLHLARRDGSDAPDSQREASGLQSRVSYLGDLDERRDLLLLRMRPALRAGRRCRAVSHSNPQQPAALRFAFAAGALAPAIMGGIATYYSIAAGLPLLASGYALGAAVLWELTDFIGQKSSG